MDSVKVGLRQRRKINNHGDLEKSYKEAKQIQAMLHVFLINSQVSRSSSTTSVSDKDWSRSGAWNDRILDGWAGGADRKNLQDARHRNRTVSSHNHSQHSNAKGSRQDGSGIDTTTARSSADGHRRMVLEDNPDVTLTTTITSFQSQHRKKPRNSVKGIMRSKGESRKTRKISFTASSGTSSTKYFTTGTSANEWLSAVQVERLSVDEKEKSPKELVEEAVQRGSCSDLIEVLENGACADSEVVARVLREQYEQIKVQSDLLDFKGMPFPNLPTLVVDVLSASLFPIGYERKEDKFS